MDSDIITAQQAVKLQPWTMINLGSNSWTPGIVDLGTDARVMLRGLDEAEN